MLVSSNFFFNDTATTEIYTLSLHDALPIWLVHFWYQSDRSTGMPGDLDQAIDRLINRVSTGRADGSLVRLSIPLRDARSESTARGQLLGFGRMMAPHLKRHWPVDVPGA